MELKHQYRPAPAAGNGDFEDLGWTQNHKRAPIKTYYNPLQLLAPLRGYDGRSGSSFRGKTKIFDSARNLKLRPETEAYYLFAGENYFVGGALGILIFPNEAIGVNESLGIVELCSVILPVAVLSEWLNNMLYQRSLLTDGDSSKPFYQAINDLFNGFSSKKEGSTGKALKSLLFTALWGLYQTIRVPVLLTAMFTALVLWIPKMIVGFVMGTSVFATRPAWYPIAVGAYNVRHAIYDYKVKKQQESAHNHHHLGDDTRDGHDGKDRRPPAYTPPPTGPEGEEETPVFDDTFTM